jgi:hypothetical protein
MQNNVTQAVDLLLVEVTGTSKIAVIVIQFASRQVTFA